MPPVVGRAIVMPNLKPPVTTTALVRAPAVSLAWTWKSSRSCPPFTAQPPLPLYQPLPPYTRNTIPTARTLFTTLGERYPFYN